MSDSKVLVRLDDRLIHGQVIFDWLRSLEPVDIMVIHETLDEKCKGLLRAALVQRYRLWVGTAEQAAEFLRRHPLTRNLLALLPDPAELQLLVEAGYKPRVVILGAQGWQENRQRISNQVYLSPEEKEVLRLLALQGLRYVIQARYQDTPVIWHPAPYG